MKKFNNIYKVIGASAALFMLSCNNDLDQVPDNIPSADSVTEFTEVLNAAYFYQHSSATPLAVMGDFRADNAVMYEEPYPAFDRFNSDLAEGDLEAQFFIPIYANLYNSILSANNVIINFSTDPYINIGTILSIGDYLYIKSGVTNQVTLIGEVKDKVLDLQNGTNYLIVDTTITDSAGTPIGNLPPTSPSYYFFIKNGTAESQGILGHYAVFTLTNNNTGAVELFAVGSEVMKSFP